MNKPGNSMRHIFISLGLWAGLLMLSACASSPYDNVFENEAQQKPALSDEDKRLEQSSFEKAYADLEHLTVRREGAWLVSSYFATKAWAWIAFAEQEWQERDETDAAQDALLEARSLMVEMSQASPAQQDNISMHTALISDSEHLRDDLWQQAAGFKRHAGFRCAEPEIAELEVTLVHAGHEQQELGWRHARSEIAAAERLAKEIPVLLGNCVAPQPVVACGCQADEVIELLPKYIYFGLDSDQLNTAAKRKLDDVVAYLQNWPDVFLMLEGHTDALANSYYNMGLSARRAQAVAGYLQLSGIPATRFGVRALGEQKRRSESCDAVSRALDRRVEIRYVNAGKLELTEDQLGIEVESIPLPANKERCQ